MILSSRTISVFDYLYSEKKLTVSCPLKYSRPLFPSSSFPLFFFHGQYALPPPQGVVLFNFERFLAPSVIRGSGFVGF